MTNITISRNLPYPAPRMVKCQACNTKVEHITKVKVAPRSHKAMCPECVAKFHEARKPKVSALEILFRDGATACFAGNRAPYVVKCPRCKAERNCIAHADGVALCYPCIKQRAQAAARPAWKSTRKHNPEALTDALLSARRIPVWRASRSDLDTMTDWLLRDAPEPPAPKPPKVEPVQPTPILAPMVLDRAWLQPGALAFNFATLSEFGKAFWTAHNAVPGSPALKLLIKRGAPQMKVNPTLEAKAA